MIEAMFYTKKENNRVQCNLCPHYCVMEENQLGRCQVRKNFSGVLYSLNYACLSSIAIDPIEKKPLHKWRPNTEIFSIGSFGCNMSCAFCQNHVISKEFNLENEKGILKVKPYQVIEEAKFKKQESIAYTYNEPTVFYEMVYDTSVLAKKAGMANVLVTNGFINKEPLIQLLPYIDAMNVDVKTYNDDLYKSVCDGSLQPVLETIKLALSNKVHVEITCLIVPGLNDELDKSVLFFQYLREQIGDCYIHLSRYFPRYHYEESATPIELLIKMEQIAKKYFSQVTLGNVR